MNKEEVLKECTVDGVVVKLPDVQLDREAYLGVEKAMELIGGKWKGGKVAGFVFKEDPTELLQQIANGDKRNLKKEFQFFGTPDSLADILVDLADIHMDERILEPSAGQGAIVKAIDRCITGKKVYCFELMPVNRTILDKCHNAEILGDDFLKYDESVKFDKIIANPPFAKNQDILHIKKMYGCLNNGGRLVTIASNHWRTCNNKKETEFREWLSEKDSYVLDIESGEFKESGTNIATCMIVIEID